MVQYDNCYSNEFWYCGPQASPFPRGHSYCFCDFLYMEILVRLVLYILEKKVDRTSHHVIKKLKLLKLNPVFRWNHALNNFFTLMANSYPTDMLLSNIIHVIWCFRKKNAIIKLLLEHKADPSVQNNSGQTAIHLAIAKEQDETVKALVLASCDVHVKVSKISRSELLSSF